MGVEKADLSQLKSEGWGSAVISLGNELLGRQAKQLSDATVDLLLNGMISPQISVEGPSHLSGCDQEAGMFSGAVVFERATSPVRNRTLEMVCFQLGIPEKTERLPCMSRRSGVGRTADGDSPFPAAVGLRSSTAQKGQGLKGFER